MNKYRIKHWLSAMLSPSILNLITEVWRSGARAINRTYFKLFCRDVVMLDTVRVQEGQHNQPFVIDYLLNCAVGGFYLDIGANHPKIDSNTYFFEMNRDYSGIAFDPLTKYEREWETQRPLTKCMNIAAGSAKGQVRFFQYGKTDSISDRLCFTEQSSRREYIGSTESSIVDVLPMTDVYGIPASISFASIDVKGAEMDVLKGFGESVRPTILVVENRSRPIGSNELRAQVILMGYRFVARISNVDDVFVRSDVVVNVPDLRLLRDKRRDLFH